MSLSSLRAAAALSLAAYAPALGAQRASADSTVSAPVANMHYEVRADRAAMEARRLRVTTTFDVSGAAPVILALPAWTPGAYEISDFARNVSGFSAAQGERLLRWDKLDHDSWRVWPRGGGTVTVAFDYAADSMDNAMAWTRSDFALFNGTNVFLHPEGRSLGFASTVRIVTDADFRVATGLAWSGRAHEYRAPDYHELVDNPVFVGAFDYDSATISAKTVRYATYPKGSVAGAARLQAWDQLKRIIPVQVNVFGEAPWANYTVMQVVDSGAQGYSGLEHASSHLDVVAPNFVGSPIQPSLYAHEIFHAWNVKRLRPLELSPYRYDRMQPTPWLWVSEGITDYYADLTEVRGGMVDAQGFYDLTAGKIAEIGATVPFALEDASVNTWVHPKDGTAYSYYPKGSLAGLMLDIVIRDASENRRSLDTVLRELYETTYKRGRGFGFAEFWGAARRAANGRAFDEFHRKYVDGRDPYPWPEMLRTMGLRMVSDSAPRLGVSTAPDPAGAVIVVDVAAGSPAARAGVQAGDAMVSVGDVEVADAQFGARFRARYMGRAAGTPIDIVVKRGTSTLTLKGPLVYAPSAPRIVEDDTAPAKAVKLRNGILRGTMDR